jgi:beta-phosphoglucomutase-like phosphatase (HAD superfamily)
MLTLIMNNPLESAIELSGPPQLIIADGAGTLFDPKSETPAFAFRDAFADKGITISVSTIMKEIGSDKKHHIKSMLKESEIRDQVLAEYGEDGPQDADVNALHILFKEKLMPLLPKTREIVGAQDAAFALKTAGIPLVMTTGYDREIVKEIEEALPWLKEVLIHSVTSSDVAKGRPAPDMIHIAMQSAKITQTTRAVKTGDSAKDMQAPDNVNMPGVIVKTGSIIDDEHASRINKEIGRNHLVVASVVDVVRLVLNGTLKDEIHALNK